MDWDKRRSTWEKRVQDVRSPFEIDYARIVHSASFRRLQGKTQILKLGDNDFYRTRLTHSLEVAQIASGILQQFKACYPSHQKVLPETSLVQTIGFAHDLGHPPFGHGGEIALNYCMRDHGGFEGNGQTLRILSTLETFSAQNGADLTRRALLGILKYPAAYSVLQNKNLWPCLDERLTSIKIIDRNNSKPPKCFLDSEQDVVNWILEKLSKSDQKRFQKIRKKSNDHHETIHKSFDCSIMDVADDIAYGVHDLEDAIALELISEEDFRKKIPPKICPSFLEFLKHKNLGQGSLDNSVYDNFVQSLFGDSANRKRFISRLVYHFLANVTIKTLDGFEEELLRNRAKLGKGQQKFLDALRKLVRSNVIESPSVQHFEFKGQKIIVSIFEALLSSPKSLLPRDTYERYKSSGEQSKAHRVICDYIAGMTDESLVKLYDRLFSPRMGSVFDKF